MRFCQVAHLIIDDGITDTLGELVHSSFAASSVLVVTDKSLRALGLLDAALASLEDAGLLVRVYDDVSPDPPDIQVQAAADMAADMGADLIIGFGGGSVMDVAKVTAVLALGEQALSDMYGVDRVKSRRLSLVQIPTTAGTGSEVTNVAIVTTGETTKSGIVSPVLYADMAVLDAKLTLGLPRHITAATGIDAMVHAIEAFTSKRLKNPMSDMLAKDALCRLGGALVTACADGNNMAARRDMLIGAMQAGQAFSNAPVGAVHALAYPLGGHFHISHGLSNALVMPHVMDFNMDAATALYAELGRHLHLPGDSDTALVTAFVDWLEGLAVDSGAERRLRDVGIPEDAVPMLARESMKQERLLINNPKVVSERDARALYEAAW